MMDDATAKDLGLRALAAGFRWAPGVKLGSADETYRLTFAWYSGDDDEGATPVLHPAGDGIGPGWGWPADGSGWWPDFRDPATLGVLLAQARRRHGQPCAQTGWDFESWSVRVVVYDDDDDPPTVCGVVHLGTGPTEAAALVAALEAAD